MCTKNPLVRGEDQRVKKGKGLVKLKQAEYLLSGSCHICLCIVRIHGFFQSGDSTDDRKECVNTGFIAGNGFFCDTSCKSDGFCTIFFAEFCDTYRSFSHGGLMIQTSLAGYDNIGVFHFILKMDSIQDELDARSQFSV